MTPKAPDYNSNIISRVDMMQYIYQQASEAIANLDMALDDYIEAQSWIEELKAYKESGQWKEDVAANEKGEIPADIDKDILLEDDLDNLLKDAEKIVERVRGI